MAFALSQFRDIFAIRNRLGKPFIIIGGQAVNYWAETYFREEPALRNWLPFTSKDIDFHGGRAEVLEVAKTLGLRAELPHKKQMTTFAGSVPFKIEELRTNIEFVRQIPGVENRKVEGLAVAARKDGCELRVLDPISLLPPRRIWL